MSSKEDPRFDVELDLEIREEFGRAASACRKANMLGRSELAKRAGMDPRTIVRIENAGNVRKASVFRLAAALEHLDPNLFFDFLSGEVTLTAPDQVPALLVAEWRDQKVRKKNGRVISGKIDSNHSVARAWKSLRELCDDILKPGFPKWPRDLGLSALLFVVHFSMLTGARGWIHGTPCRCGF